MTKKNNNKKKKKKNLRPHSIGQLNAIFFFFLIIKKTLEDKIFQPVSQDIQNIASKKNEEYE